MILSERLKNRLVSASRRTVLEQPILDFLGIWTDRRATGATCYNALHDLCRTFDSIGEYHAAEEVMASGMIVLEQEPERRRVARNNNVLLAIGGAVVGGLLVRALVRR